MRHFEALPLIGILRGADTRTVEAAVSAALAGGMATLEITLNHPEACAQIALLKARHGEELTLGAGTVLTTEAANRALAAGAEFMVMPAVLPEVIQFCLARQVPVFPGALTPTEIIAAHQAGASMVKVFPAASLGPDYIKNLQGPLSHIKLIPTGGGSGGSRAAVAY
jgi:2-dehydro-3-deoxyphosphogluconate aldolase/(4S)-4-hydroxy-2-oxoglutarate aldolase